MPTPLSFIAYTALMSRSSSTAAVHMANLRDQNKITNDTYNERMAIALPERPEGNLVWLHAGTERAYLSAVELFRRLRDDRPDLNGLLTANFEPSGFQIQPVESLWLTHAPEERSAPVRRFLSHWSPDCVIWIGGKFRPALLNSAQSQNIPSLSIAAPDSATDLDVSYSVPGLRSATLRCFDHIITNVTGDHAAWRRAGVHPDSIAAHGYLEEGTRLPHFNESELNALSEEIGTRPVWFASNVEKGEVQTALCAHKTALRRAHRLLLILSIEDPNEVSAIREACLEQGLTAITRQEGCPITEDVQVLIVEDREEDGLWLRLAPVTFLGHSLSDAGGTDPYPAATFGSAMIHGPNVKRFANAYERFRAADATLIAFDTASLAQAVDTALAADVAAQLAHAGWEVCSAGAEVTDRVTHLVHDILDLREEMSA